MPVYADVFIIFSGQRRQKYGGRAQGLLPAAGNASAARNGRKIAWHEWMNQAVAGPRFGQMAGNAHPRYFFAWPPMKMTIEGVNLLSSPPANTTLEGITPASLEKGAMVDGFSTALTGQMTLLSETGELPARVPAKSLDGLPRADGKEHIGFGNALPASYKKMTAANLEAGFVSTGAPKAVTAAMIPDTALAAQNESQAMTENEPALAQPLPEAEGLTSPDKSDAARPDDLMPRETVPGQPLQDNLPAPKAGLDGDMAASLMALTDALKTIAIGAAPEDDAAPAPREAVPQRQPGLDLPAPKAGLDGDMAASLSALTDALKTIATGAAPEDDGVNSPVKTEAAPVGFRQKAPPRQPDPDNPGISPQTPETGFNEDGGASLLALNDALKAVMTGAAPQADPVSNPGKGAAAPLDFRQTAPPRQPGPDNPGISPQTPETGFNEDGGASLLALNDALKAVMAGEIPGTATKTPNPGEAMAVNGFSFAKPLPEAAGLKTTGKTDAAPADFLQKDMPPVTSAWDKSTADLPILDTTKPAEKTATVEKQAILPGLEKAAAGVGAEMTPLQRPIENRTESPAIARPLTHPDWSKDLGEQIVWMNNKTLSAAEIRLNPAHLGPLSVRIDINQDQAAIVFTAHHADVREALEASLPKLREMLGAQQLNLVNVNVSQHSTPDQGHPSPQNFQPPPENREPGRDAIAESLEKIEHEHTIAGIADKGLLSLYA